MRKIVLSLVLLGLIGGAFAEGNPKSKSATKATSPAARDPLKTQEQVDWLNKLDEHLTRCNSAYEGDNALLKATIGRKKAFFAMKNGEEPSLAEYTGILEEAQKELAPQAKYATCYKEARADVMATSKGFIQGLVEPNLQSKARETIGQWMTALDAVMNKNFVEEQSKFKSLMNTLKLELQLG